MSTRSVIGWGAAVAVTLGVLSPAMARPGYLNAFKRHYNTAQSKPTLNAANCTMCHIGAPNTRMWNGYGQALRQALGARNVTDAARITGALEQAGRARNASRNQTYAALIGRDILPASQGTGQPPAQAGGLGGGAWQALFNGQNMNGWTKMNQGNWMVENGVLKYTGGGNGWLRSNNQYRNYSLVVVWKYTRPSAQNDSGIFLKAGMQGNPWPTGAVQLNMGPGDNMGSIGGMNTTRARADLIKRNDWNTYQITVSDGAVTLAINGQVAWQQGVSPALAQPGYVGIQAENQAVEFQGIWIRPLP
ncbi:MAG: DUF1080 domain-containing protein [Armatimonadetes bacterium]|nr:DUF1080 domain-containing protein [Armatimonadota bacterium]